jgi:hypothetical protein
MPMQLVSALALLLWCAAAELPKKEPGMEAHTPVCEVNLYGVITLLEVDSSRPGEWAQDPENRLNRRRTTTVIGRVKQVLQGTVAAKSDQAFRIHVIQRAPISGRIADDYGPWSGAKLDSGQRLLAFCERAAAGDRLEPTLETFTRLVINLPANAFPFALEDVTLAVSLKRRPQFPSILQDGKVQQEVMQQHGRMGPIMARFLFDASAELKSPRLDPLLSGILEAADTPPLCRAELLRLLVEDLGLHEEAPIDRRIRLARGMLAALKEPAKTAAALHERILQTDLRNTLFDEADEPLLGVEQVLPAPKEGDDLGRVLAGLELDDDLRALLMKWLHGELKPKKKSE